jgi:hypothetical protein
LKRDKQATAKKKFCNPKSYVAPDGREVLYGGDWALRLQELRERCGGRCEHVVDKGIDSFTEAAIEIRCKSEAQDPHHVIPRSKKRDDRLGNLLAICRRHHILLDERKIRSDKRAK